MRPPSTRSLRLFVLLGAALAPVLLAYILLVRQSIAIPLLDDYPSILYFAEHLQQQPSAGQKLLYIASAQHNEYKLILVHSVVALELLLLHRISLSLLIALGNLAPLLILAVLWLNAFRDEPDLSQRLFLFLPVPFLLFQLNYAEAFDWAMPTLQNLGVIALSLLAIHLLLASTRSTRSSRRGLFASAVAGAVLACSASAGAFLLAPIGLLILLLRRSYRAMLAWCFPFATMLLVYLYRYVRITSTPHARPLPMLAFFVSFLGSGYENMHHKPLPFLSVILGTAFLLAFAAELRAHAWKSHPFVCFSTLFILGTAALATVGRSGMGLEASLSARYKIYSDLLLIFTFLSLVTRARNTSPARARRLASAALALAVLLCSASDIVGYKFLSKRRSQLIAGLRQYQASPSTATPMLNPNGIESPGFSASQEQARVILTRSLQLGLYRPPALP